VPTDPPVQPTGLGKLLLTADELPARWTVLSVHEYTADGGEDPLAEVCPAAGSIDVIRSSSRGRPTSGPISTSLPSSSSARWGRPRRPRRPSPTTWSGGVVDVPGADTAGRLAVEARDLGSRSELVVVAVGPIVMVLSGEGDLNHPAAVVELATHSTAKVAATR
jgi:hypothetical protein